MAKNFYDLFKLLEKENPEILRVLEDDFLEDWREGLKNIHLGAAERKKNLESFVKSSVGDINGLEGVFASPYYVISTVEKASAQAKKKVDLEKTIKEFCSATKKPVDMVHFDFFDSLSRAKCLGYKMGSTDYYFNIDGYFYNFSLVHEVFNIIGHSPKKGYGSGITFELTFPERDSFHPLLFMRTSFGIAFILPTLCPGKYEVSWNTFRAISDKIDDLFTKWIYKTA